MRYFIFASLVVFGISCKPKTEEKVPILVSNLSGEELAKTQCASCHLFPKPSDLPKEIWLTHIAAKFL
jgi:hypothetical protein